MAWIVKLVFIGAEGEEHNADVMRIARPDDLTDLAALGLTLAEGKQLLAGVQREIVAAQARPHAARRPECRGCVAARRVKNYRHHPIATLFGQVAVRLPRFRCAACATTETSVGWPPPCSGRSCRWTQAGPRDPAPPHLQGHRLRRRLGPARLGARSGPVRVARGGSTRTEAGGPHRPGRPEDARDADGPAQPPRAQARAERRARPVARVGEGAAEPQSSSARQPAAAATAPLPPAKSARDPLPAEPSRPARRGGADAAWAGQYLGWSPRAAL